MSEMLAEVLAESVGYAALNLADNALGSVCDTVFD
jgi:hypothetical protein